MHPLVSLVAVCLLCPFASAQTRGSCKVSPSSLQWPGKAAWDRLNTTVSGRLLKPLAPAAACHKEQPNYDETTCGQVSTSFRSGSFHINHPTSNFWQNYNNYSCVPDSAAPCTADGYPVYVVEAQSAKDVQAAVNFARTNNIRLNIKSTGHDFLGRSIQPKSLSIWTHSLKGQKWFNSSFTPEGCSFAIPGPAVAAGAGSQWGEMGTAAASRGVMLVGGASRTVSLGGFLSNGGHGALSAKFGLGADMVMEIDAVTADGQLVKANECQNKDLFWAMRGGGGSTYAVAIAYTLQAIPTLPATRWMGMLMGWDQIIYMHSQWPKLAAAGVSGYINGYPARSSSASLSMTMPNATSRSVLEAILTPILAGMPGRPVVPKENVARDGGGPDGNDPRPRRYSTGSSPPTSEVEAMGTYYHFKTWAEAEKQAGVLDADDVEAAREQLQRRQAAGEAVPRAAGASNKIITSWLWSTADCQKPNLGTALRGAFDRDTQLLNDLTMGVGTWKTPYMRGGGNAVNPAFRAAAMRPAAELMWSGTNVAVLQKKKADALKFGLSLKSLNPKGGTYANEADPDFPDWQHAFWGSNYERLLSIKRKVDPQGVFYCRACVGSELWEDRAGVLCKK